MRAETPTPVTVVRDGSIRAAGLRLGDAVVYDWGFDWHDRSWEQRSFVLLSEGFQINQPVIFPPDQQGWWYCDLVKVDLVKAVGRADVVSVDDHWIDVIVGPPDHPYRVLDLDEFADAFEAEQLNAAEFIDGLTKTQRFLDRHLNRRDDPQQTWPDFPPQSIAPLMDITFERTWSS
jgi:Protein of unknown function (DUF402)